MSKRFEAIVDDVAAETCLPIPLVERVADLLLSGLRDALKEPKSEVDSRRAVFRAFHWDEERHGAVVLFKPWGKGGDDQDVD